METPFKLSISHFFLAKPPLEPPILKATSIVMGNNQNIVILNIFAKRSNRLRNSTLNITIERVPENVAVSVGKRNLNTITLNENDLKNLSLNIQKSVKSFKLIIIARESASDGEISTRRSVVQITKMPPVPSPKLFVAPVCYVQNAISVSLNVTLVESNEVDIMHSLNITVPDGFEVLGANHFIPGIYTLSVPLLELIILKFNKTIDAPFHVLFIAKAQRLSSKEESVTRQKVVVNQCRMTGTTYQIIIKLNRGACMLSLVAYEESFQMYKMECTA